MKLTVKIGMLWLLIFAVATASFCASFSSETFPAEHKKYIKKINGNQADKETVEFYKWLYENIGDVPEKRMGNSRGSIVPYLPNVYLARAYYQNGDLGNAKKYADLALRYASENSSLRQKYPDQYKYCDEILKNYEVRGAIKGCKECENLKCPDCKDCQEWFDITGDSRAESYLKNCKLRKEEMTAFGELKNDVNNSTNLTSLRGSVKTGITGFKAKYPNSKNITKLDSLFTNKEQELILKSAFDEASNYYQRREYKKCIEITKAHSSVQSFKTLQISAIEKYCLSMARLLRDSSVNLETAESVKTYIDGLRGSCKELNDAITEAKLNVQYSEADALYTAGKYKDCVEKTRNYIQYEKWSALYKKAASAYQKATIRTLKNKKERYLRDAKNIKSYLDNLSGVSTSDLASEIASIEGEKECLDLIREAKKENEAGRYFSAIDKVEGSSCSGTVNIRTAAKKGILKNLKTSSYDNIKKSIADCRKLQKYSFAKNEALSELKSIYKIAFDKAKSEYGKPERSRDLNLALSYVKLVQQSVYNPQNSVSDLKLKVQAAIGSDADFQNQINEIKNKIKSKTFSNCVSVIEKSNTALVVKPGHEVILKYKKEALRFCKNEIDKKINSGNLDRAKTMLSKLLESDPGENAYVSDKLTYIKNFNRFKNLKTEIKNLKSSCSYEDALVKCAEIINDSTFTSEQKEEGRKLKKEVREDRESLDMLVRRAQRKLDSKNYQEAASFAVQALEMCKHNRNAQNIKKKAEEIIAQIKAFDRKLSVVKDLINSKNFDNALSKLLPLYTNRSELEAGSPGAETRINSAVKLLSENILRVSEENSAADRNPGKSMTLVNLLINNSEMFSDGDIRKAESIKNTARKNINTEELRSNYNRGASLLNKGKFLKAAQMIYPYYECCADECRDCETNIRDCFYGFVMTASMAELEKIKMGNHEVFNSGNLKFMTGVENYINHSMKVHTLEKSASEGNHFYSLYIIARYIQLLQNTEIDSDFSEFQSREQRFSQLMENTEKAIEAKLRKLKLPEKSESAKKYLNYLVFFEKQGVSGGVVDEFLNQYECLAGFNRNEGLNFTNLKLDAVNFILTSDFGCYSNNGEHNKAMCRYRQIETEFALSSGLIEKLKKKYPDRKACFSHVEPLPPPEPLWIKILSASLIALIFLICICFFIAKKGSSYAIPPVKIQHELGAWTDKQLAGFLISGRISKTGGQAEIYEAVRLNNENHRYAMKIPRERMLRDPEKMNQFISEANITARLKHPNIIKVLKLDTASKPPYILMELFNGLDLGFWMSRADFKPSEKLIASIIIKTAEALHYAHKAKLVHRDVKPGNIMVSFNHKKGTLEQLRVIDFGIAGDMKGFAGSLPYIAPEAIVNGIGASTAQSDIFCLGLILMNLMTGGLMLPFKDVKGAREYYSYGKPVHVPVSEPKIRRLLLGMLQVNPNNRFRTMEEVIEQVNNAMKVGK